MAVCVTLLGLVLVFVVLYFVANFCLNNISQKQTFVIQERDNSFKSLQNRAYTTHEAYTDCWFCKYLNGLIENSRKSSSTNRKLRTVAAATSKSASSRDEHHHNNIHRNNSKNIERRHSWIPLREANGLKNEDVVLLITSTSANGLFAIRER